MATINRDRYPLEDEARRAALVEDARRQLEETGAAAFHDFVTPAGVAEMMAEATGGFKDAYRRDLRMGFNPQGPLAHIIDDELLERLSPYSMWILGSDLLPGEGALQRFYNDPTLIALVRESLGIETLHTTADPLINVNVTYMGAGDQHGWHFDDNDFVVSLLLQAPDAGGAFEYAPDVDTASLGDIHEILDGSSCRTKTHSVGTGTLLLFRGRKALHRVAPVQGDAKRIIALLSYHSEPGFRYSDTVRMNGLGRSEPIAA